MSGTANRNLPSNQRNFGATPPIQAQRSTFKLDKTWKGTFDAGQLIPFYVSEGLPGDTRKVRVQAIARLATPIKPFMDNLYLDFHFWWCPNRQLWDNWTKLMGEQDNPGDSIDFLVPQMPIQNGSQNAPLHDYMGVSSNLITSGRTTNISALPGRMYNRVYNFHYRDQNLIPSISQPTGDGPDAVAGYTIRKRGKRHDYFTASLPFQQKGDPVNIPLGTTAPISTFGVQGNPIAVETQSGTKDLDATLGPVITVNTALGDPLFADLANAAAATITDIRQAIAIQHVLERDARSGTRYPEILMSRFRVTDPQMLVLQRPEYLGGGTKMVNVAPIPQTTQTSPSGSPNLVETPQGNLAAVGTAMIDGIGFTRSFTEHGFIMGIVSARADLTYQQGIERMWHRRARFDFYTPELAHLSEQAVQSKELYCDGNTADDESVWGYIGAYDEYRYGVNLITSLFRSDNPTPLDVWHLAQDFATRPTLNATFIEENPPVDRVIATQEEPHFIMDAYISDTAARPLPVTSIPGLSRI